MKSIQFFGGAGMVTGSCYLLTGDDDSQILIDLGMFQGNDEVERLNYEPLGFDVSRLTAVVLTHAHLDHSGRLPLLINAGYTGKIYMTKATRMLAALVLMDSAKVAVENVNHKYGKGGDNNSKILYTNDEVEALLNHIEEVEYDKEFILGGFKVIFRDAGHILGSASIEISDNTGKKIVFSGDLGNTPEDMIRPTQMINKADYVVMEATYGDRLHQEENPSEVLREEINEIENSNGVLLIPSFSIERAQEILHRINHLKNEKKIALETKVFLDSPMAIRATEIFRRSPELFNSELSKELKTDDPFDFPGLTICQSSEESKEILLNSAPKVIISGSGMMHGGRVLHHAVNYLPDFKTRLLLVGYQAPGTLGYLLNAGMTRVRIYDKEVQVKAHVRMVEAMSCHADQKKLLVWLKCIKGTRQVFLTHGEDEARKIFLKLIKNETEINDIVIPEMGELVSLN